jgi:sugar lactone lactonase YvrE
VWQPPVPPARGGPGAVPLPPLTVIEINGTGPEDVVVDGEGHVLTGVEDGRILRVSPDGRFVERIADTGGRPLGLELLPDGGVLVCDAWRGLLRVDPKRGDVEALVEEVAGERMRFCNNAAVAPDGTVYFSDTSRRFGIDHWKADVLEHSGTGRLLRRGPGGEVDVLADGLQFANGVALAPDGSFVAVAETGSYRITRLWLTGERAGRTEVLADNLPGFPDNISTGPDGLIWVAVGSPRNAMLDRLHRMHPAFRKAVWALPERLQPAAIKALWVLGLDTDGRVVHDLRGPGDEFTMVTGVRVHEGKIYLGSLVERAIGVLDLA